MLTELSITEISMLKPNQNKIAVWKMPQTRIHCATIRRILFVETICTAVSAELFFNWDTASDFVDQKKRICSIEPNQPKNFLYQFLQK